MKLHLKVTLEVSWLNFNEPLFEPFHLHQSSALISEKHEKLWLAPNQYVSLNQ